MVVYLGCSSVVQPKASVSKLMSTLHFSQCPRLKMSIKPQTSVTPCFASISFCCYVALQKDGEMRTVKFTLESLVELSSVRLLLPPDLRAPEKRAAVGQNMKEAFRRCDIVVESYSLSLSCVHSRLFLIHACMRSFAVSFWLQVRPCDRSI